jgi:hypothetical protein
VITVKVKGNRIIPEVIHPGTAGSYRERITLDLSEEWSDLLCKIDFYPIKGKPVSIVWGDEEKKNGVKVPLEVMKYSGMADYVVSGFIMDGDNLGEKLISVTGHMKISATRGEANNAVNPEAPTPNVYEQLRDSMIRDIDAALREAKESGEFDGKSPYIGSNGNWWIGDKDTGVKANISAQAVLFSPQLLSESEKTTARKNIDAPDCVITSAEGDTFTVTNALDRRLRGLSVYGRSEVSEDISPDDIHINTPIPGINSIGEKGSISVSVGSTNLRIPIGDSVIGIAADGLLGVTESGDEIEETYTDKNGQRWVSDEIDFSRGVYIQRIGKIVFGENTNVETEGQANTYSIELSSLGMGLPKNGANCLCNIFTGSPVDGFLGTEDHFISVVDTKVYIHSSRYENGGAEEMKSHFASLARAGTPVLLYYVLDRPVEIPLTEFLTENVRKLALQKGECAATTDEGAWIKIEYAADIKQYIDEKLSGGTGGETDPEPSRDPVVLANVTTTEQTNALVIPLGDDVRNYSRLLITLTMKHYKAASSPGIYLWDTVGGYQHGRLTDFKGLFNETSATTVYFDVTFFANSVVVTASKKVSSISASDGVVSMVSNLSSATGFDAELIDAIRISSMYMDTGAKIKVEGVPR